MVGVLGSLDKRCNFLNFFFFIQANLLSRLEELNVGFRFVLRGLVRYWANGRFSSKRVDIFLCSFRLYSDKGSL